MGGKGAVRRASNFPERACTRSAALCARAVCVGKKRRVGQGLAASSGKAKAHRPTHQGCSISRRQRGGKGKRCSRVNCQVQSCTVATEGVLYFPHILERQKI